MNLVVLILQGQDLDRLKSKHAVATTERMSLSVSSRRDRLETKCEHRLGRNFSSSQIRVLDGVLENFGAKVLAWDKQIGFEKQRSISR